MNQAVSTVEAREHFSDLINRAAYGNERVVLERRNKALAAMISYEDLEWFEILEDLYDLHAAKNAIKEAKAKGTISSKDMAKAVGLKDE